MPRLRAPVSGSCVTTHGNVMKRPPSSGQHLRMGRSASVGGNGSVPFRQSGASGQASLRLVGASNRWMTSLQGPLFTVLGFAWRKSKASDRSRNASFMEAGGRAFMSPPSSAATSSTEAAFMLMAMRFQEPSVLMATGNGETTPRTVGFSKSNALPPPGFFISRSAISVISNSVATGCEMRINSPAFSSNSTQSRNDSNAMLARRYGPRAIPQRWDLQNRALKPGVKAPAWHRSLPHP